MPRVYREDNRRAWSCRKGARERESRTVLVLSARIAIRHVPGTPAGALSPRISRDPFFAPPTRLATAKFTRVRLGEVPQRNGVSKDVSDNGAIFRQREILNLRITTTWNASRV